MRSLLLPLLLHFGLLVAGLGILHATRAIDKLTLRGILAAGGLAYLVGAAVVMQTCVLLLTLGAPFGLPMVALVCGVFAVPLSFHLGLTARRPRRISMPLRVPADDRLAVVALGAFALFAVFALAMSANQPLGTTDYDAWNLFARKALLLFDGSHLPLAVLQSPASGYIHPDYPLVLSLLEAAHFRALGTYELSSVHTVIWALAIAFVWAGVFLSARVVRPTVAAIVFPGVVMLTVGDLLTGYADLPMVFYLGLGVLSLGIWLESGRRRDLVIALLLFAGAVGLKNEGLMGTVAALASVAIVLAVARAWGRLRELALMVVPLAALAIAPWRVWLAAHHLKGDIPVAKGLDPGFLAHRISRVWPAVQALYGQLDNVSTVAIAVPVALAVVLLRLRARERSSTVAFYLLVGLLYFALLLWAYWISPLEIHFHIETSVTRIYFGVAFIALVAILQLGGRSLTPSDRGSGSPPTSSVSDEQTAGVKSHESEAAQAAAR